jgi:DNA-binding transcriptional regulator YhcF (GntR family)
MAEQYESRLAGCRFAQIDQRIIREIKKSTSLRVYLAVASHADGATGEAFPSVDTIAQVAGVAERETQRALRELELAGWIATFDRGSRKTSRYVVQPFVEDDFASSRTIASSTYRALCRLRDTFGVTLSIRSREVYDRHCFWHNTELEYLTGAITELELIGYDKQGFYELRLREELEGWLLTGADITDVEAALAQLDPEDRESAIAAAREAAENAGYISDDRRLELINVAIVPSIALDDLREGWREVADFIHNLEIQLCRRTLPVSQLVAMIRKVGATETAGTLRSQDESAA